MKRQIQESNIIILIFMFVFMFHSMGWGGYADENIVSVKASDMLKKAKNAIFKKEWAVAVDFLEKLKNGFPQNLNSDRTLYWLAYSQNKLSLEKKEGKEKINLKKTALGNLDYLIKTFGNSDWVDDAKILRIEISVFLVQSGFPEYKKYIMNELESSLKRDSNLKRMALIALSRIEKEHVYANAPVDESGNGLKLIEEFLLLSIKDETGHFFSGSTRIHCGIAGIIIHELMQMGKIRLENNKLILIDSVPTGDIIFDQTLNFIKKRKNQKSLKYWVKKISKKSRIYKKMILYRLIDKRILTMETGKTFIAFNKRLYPSINSIPENRIKRGLYEIIFNKKRPDLESGLLISLIDYCNLEKSIFKENEKFRIARGRLREISRQNKIGIAVKKAIKAIKAEKFVYFNNPGIY